MSRSARTPSRKQQKRYLIIGLLIILLSVPLTLLAMLKRKGWLYVIRESEYAPYLDWIVAQSQHETANWKSSLFEENNNLFGMKVPTKREYFGDGGTKAPDGGLYAKYNKWSDSAKDYLSWLRYVNFPTDLPTMRDFVHELKKKSYFGDTEENYYNGVKHWFEVGYEK